MYLGLETMYADSSMTLARPMSCNDGYDKIYVRIKIYYLHVCTKPYPYIDKVSHY